KPCFGFEDAMEMECTQASLGGQHGQIHGMLGSLDLSTGPCYQGRVPGGHAAAVGSGAPARPKTCRLGLFGCIEKAHVLAARQARRTAGPAVHARGAHRINKIRIGSGIARAHSRPSGFFGRIVSVRLRGIHVRTTFSSLDNTVLQNLTARIPVLAVELQDMLVSIHPGWKSCASKISCLW